MKKKVTSGSRAFTLVELIAVIAVLGILAAIAIPKYIDIQNRSRVKSDGATAMEIIRLARLAETDTKSTTLTIVEGYVKKNFNNNAYPAPQSGGTYVLARSGNYWTVTWTPTNASGYNTVQTVNESTMNNWSPAEET